MMVDGQVNVVWAKATILASGGGGATLSRSTNPKIATADGMRLAYRAGGAFAGYGDGPVPPDHALHPGGSRALITEAGAREGAYLIDRNGYRF